MIIYIPYDKILGVIFYCTILAILQLYPVPNRFNYTKFQRRWGRGLLIQNWMSNSNCSPKNTSKLNISSFLKNTFIQWLKFKTLLILGTNSIFFNINYSKRRIYTQKLIIGDKNMYFKEAICILLFSDIFRHFFEHFKIYFNYV